LKQKIKILWTREALTKLQEIKEYISRDNQTVAIKFVDKLIATTETLVDNPEKGRIVPELTIENIRELLYKNYRIVYIIKKCSIDILTVFERHQLLKKEEISKKIN
jgi:toxin ParE1/3/4